MHQLSNKSKSYGKSTIKAMLMSTATSPKTFKKQYKKDCSLCGRQGHKANDCFKRPENAHKRPPPRAATSKNLPYSPAVALVTTEGAS